MDARPRVAVVEDEIDLCDSMVEFLAALGYPVWGVASGEAVLARLEKEAVDVVVLDILLPGIDGFCVAKELQAKTGIVMVTAKGTLSDRVCGLMSGGDTYLVKPVDLSELAANIDAVARRVARQLRSVPVVDKETPWRIDRKQGRLITPEGRALCLTGKEYILLRHLVEAHGKVISKTRLAALLDGNETASSFNRFDVLLCRLRKKAEQALSQPLPIKAVNAQGYLLTVQCVLE